MTEAAKEARRAYHREWQRKNPHKVAIYKQRYWEKKVSSIVVCKINNRPIVLQALKDDWAKYCVKGNGGHYFKTLEEANDYLRQEMPKRRIVSYDENMNIVDLPIYSNEVKAQYEKSVHELYQMLMNGEAEKGKWHCCTAQKRYGENKQICFVRLSQFASFEVTPFMTIPRKLRMRIYRSSDLVETKIIEFEKIEQPLVDELNP